MKMKKPVIFFLIVLSFIYSSCLRNSEKSHTHEDALHNNESPEAHQPLQSAPSIRLDTVRKDSFSEIIKTGGVVLAGSGNIVTITAKSAGIIRFSQPAVYPGMKVNKGQILFFVSGGNLTGENSLLKLQQLKSDLERVRANFERAQKLYPEKIITQEQFLTAKNEYEKVLAEYDNMSMVFRENEGLILSEYEGFIRDVFVSEGQKVSPGEAIASVQTTRGMVLKALVPPDKMNKVASVRSAWFKTAGSEKLYKTEELHGKIISYGRSTGEDSFYLPLFFSIDFIPGVPEGSFAEVFLRGEEIHDVITVPLKSVMEEFGKYYVFLKDEDGDFIKRYITTAGNDGEKVIVTEGLSAGEVFVADEAYQVKLQQMSGNIPAHVHNH